MAAFIALGVRDSPVSALRSWKHALWNRNRIERELIRLLTQTNLEVVYFKDKLFLRQIIVLGYT